ncbi:MAG: hypothetical protein WDA41_10925 [Candidatus Neomarinimicrobiota bacterium]
MLTFSEETHQYTWNNEPVPSVTQVIGEWVKCGGMYVSIFTGTQVPADKFEAAGRFGTAVHKMLHSYLEGSLDFGLLTDDLLMIFTQFEAWREIFRPEPLYIERQLYSERYLYAGTMDLVCTIGRDRWIVDYKTGGYDMAGPQLAAYEKLDQEDGARKPRKRAVLYLPKDGGQWKWVPMEGRQDWTFFETRLFQYNYLKGRK